MSKFQTGSLVKFCKSPPKEIHHCGIFEWGIGLVVDFNNDTYDIFFEGSVITVSKDWVTTPDAFTFGDKISEN